MKNHEGCEESDILLRHDDGRWSIPVELGFDRGPGCYVLHVYIKHCPYCGEKLEVDDE